MKLNIYIIIVLFYLCVYHVFDEMFYVFILFKTVYLILRSIILLDIGNVTISSTWVS